MNWLLQITNELRVLIANSLSALSAKISVVEKRNRVIGGDIYISSSEPTSPNDGDVWIRI